MIPSYLDEKFKVFIQVESEDLRKILDERYFDTNPLTCLKEYLPYLAMEVGVNIDGLSEKEARIAIDEAIKSLNYKGTARSFKNSLKPFTDAKIKEWYEYEGEPYYFKAVFTPDRVDFNFNEKNLQKLTKIIDENKNVRSVLEGVEFDILFNEDIKVKGGSCINIEIDKNLEVKKEFNASFKEINALISNIKLNKDVEVRQKFDAPFKNLYGFIVNAKLNKDIKVSKNFNQDINLTSKGVSNVYLSSALNLNQEFNTKNHIKGAVIWQV